MDWKSLFKNHIEKCQESIEQILQTLKYDELILGAGSSQFYFEDDQAIPFRTSHHFSWACPSLGEKHLVRFRPGQKPQLYYHAPEDFWTEIKPVGNPFWKESFEIKEFTSDSEIWENLSPSAKSIYHGPEIEKAKELGFATNVETLVSRLNWARSFKTEYELQCTIEANKIAIKGHIAAKEAFLRGESEFSIYMSYLQATRTTIYNQPYEPIVALDEKGAFLHYPDKRDNVRDGKVLLIDAGAPYNNYASDITRTFAHPSCCDEFHSLLDSADKMQQEICNEVNTDASFASLHLSFHQKLAKLLLDHTLLQNCSVDEAIDKGYTKAFCPHGLGHMLGLHVHDVGGQQKDPEGNPCNQDFRFPTLRSTRKLEEGFLFTIEPGIYFIEMLLRPFRKTDANCFNWNLIEKLAPYGGIRIEDDLYISSNGVKNITRELWPAGK